MYEFNLGMSAVIEILSAQKHARTEWVFYWLFDK